MAYKQPVTNVSVSDLETAILRLDGAVGQNLRGGDVLRASESYARVSKFLEREISKRKRAVAQKDKRKP